MTKSTVIPFRSPVYTQEQMDHAYEVYKTDGRRSLRKAAEIVGIPFQTLSDWNRKQEWQRRLMREDERDAETRRQAAMMRLANDIDGLMDNLIELAYSGTPQDKIKFEATRHALAIASFSAVQKVEQDIIARTALPKASIRDVDSKSPEELAAIVNGLILGALEAEQHEVVIDGEFSELGRAKEEESDDATPPA